MAETHLISGLVTKRAELAGELAKLRRQIDALQADIIAVDRVLGIVGYSKAPSAIKPIERRPVGYRRGSSVNALVDMLREAEVALSSDDLTRMMIRANGRDDSDRNAYQALKKSVRLALWRLETKGVVDRLGEGVSATWRLTP